MARYKYVVVVVGSGGGDGDGGGIFFYFHSILTIKIMHKKADGFWAAIRVRMCVCKQTA